MADIIEVIQQQCERVRGILPHYEEIGPEGLFGLTMLRLAIKQGEAAIASGSKKAIERVPYPKSSVLEMVR